MLLLIKKMENGDTFESEWLAVTNSLKSYIEHPEEHTAIVFLMRHLSNETVE